MRLVWGLDCPVGGYVAAQFPIAAERGGFEVWRAIGIANSEGKLVGGIVLTDYRGHDVELTIFLDTPQALSRNLLHQLFTWAFEQQGFKRLTAHVSKRNKRSRRFVEGLGFKLEGVKKLGFHDGADECVYGMTYNNCRWLT